MATLSSKIDFWQIPGSIIDKILAVVDDDELLTAIAKEDPNDNARIRFLIHGIVGNINSNPVRSFLKIIRRRYRCFAIVEYPYLDLEEWSAYSTFYAKSFTEYPRFCHRIHFFEGSDNYADEFVNKLRSGMTKREWDALDNVKYKGFLLLRSGGHLIVGRSIVEFSNNGKLSPQSNHLHYLEKTGVPYLTTSSATTIHIGSLEFSVPSVPFMQQNPVIGVCATASIWVASQILSKQFGLRKFPFSIITKQAASRLSAPEIEFHDAKFARGLSPPEIKDALSHTGAAPIIIALRNQAEARLMLYTFVESQIPVIACFTAVDAVNNRDGHAVTLVGHLLPTDRDNCDAAECEAKLVFQHEKIWDNFHSLIGQSIQLYYAHNDNYGPFDRFQILSDALARDIQKNNPSSKTIKEAKCLITRGRIESIDHVSEEKIHDLHRVVVPLPNYVQNEPREVMLNAMLRVQKMYGEKYKGVFKFLWRFLLASGPNFKNSVVTRSYPVEMKEKYNLLHLPFYVWVAEYTMVPCGESLPLSGKRSISGEFLYDSTTPNYAPECLSARTQNHFIDFRTSENQVRVALSEIENIGCYTHTNAYVDSGGEVEQSN